MGKPGQTTVNLTKRAATIRERLAPGRTGLGYFLSAAIIYMDQQLNDGEISILMRKAELEDKSFNTPESLAQSALVDEKKNQHKTTGKTLKSTKSAG
jgi:hypothetical protein